ncbi:MAG: hypothetical protein ACQCN4_07405 [Candidatus Bathyarchaeia archaeon]|jgi:hypothetical protein
MPKKDLNPTQITTLSLAVVLILSCFVGVAGYASGQTVVFSMQEAGSASAIAALASTIEANGGWSSTLQTMYDGIALGKTTVTQLQNAVDAIDVSSTSAAEAVFYWYFQLSKFGVSINETTIKKALDIVQMLPNIGGLPNDYSRSGTPSFLLYNRYDLYAYQWAEQLNYQTSKWNLTEAYLVFNDSVTAYGKPVLCVGSDRTGWGISYGPRYYDECGETIDMYFTFWLLGIQDGLAQAEHWWNWGNANLWVNSTSGGFYKYALNRNTFECEAGGFDQIIWKLYNYNSTLPDVENLFVDMETRALSNGWASPQWADYVVMHATGNPQQRLENTIASWAAMIGFYGNMTSDMQSQVQTLLDGSAGPAPAWNLTLRSKLYDNATGMFRIHSDSSISTEATANAAVLLMLLSTVPVTGALAVPMQDCVYQDINNVIDGGVSSINLETNTVTLSVSAPGTFLSMFGTEIFGYSLNSTGIWQITFASDWNSITSQTNISTALPEGRIYLGTINSTVISLTPTPTPTASPIETPTPTPPAPSKTPDLIPIVFNPIPTPSVNPTTTLIPTQAPTPAPTPEPTDTPTQTPTQNPTDTASTTPLQSAPDLSITTVAAVALFALTAALSTLFYVKKRQKVG